MIEYPSILQAAKAPRQRCIVFEKLDGSNWRCKYTRKRGFCQFGSRTQMLDESHPILGGSIHYFSNNLAAAVEKIIKKNWPNEWEIMLFGEWFGPNSFAGWHDPEDIKTNQMKLVLFDCMVSHKNRKFLLPQDFIKLFRGVVPIPDIIDDCNLSDQLIKDVRAGMYPVDEGVVCKGCERTGAARGNVWMAKIKTQEYLDKLFAKFGQEGLEKYGE